MKKIIIGFILLISVMLSAEELTNNQADFIRENEPKLYLSIATYALISYGTDNTLEVLLEVNTQCKAFLDLMSLNPDTSKLLICIERHMESPSLLYEITTPEDLFSLFIDWKLVLIEYQLMA